MTVGEELVRIGRYSVKVTRPTKTLFPDDGITKGDGVTIRSIFDRLEKVGDPWTDFWRGGVSLSNARQKLEKLDAVRTVPQEAELH